MDRNIIIGPIVTEKAMKASDQSKYSFIVDMGASKTVIKQAIKRLFQVDPINVQTSIMKGKRARAGARRIEISKPQWKKAIVRLKKGVKISLFEPGSVEEEKDKKKKKKE